MRVAVIGCGSIGRRHIANLLAFGCEVFPFDNDGERYGVDIGATERIHHPDQCEVGGFDAVVITTPWNFHLQYVRDAVRDRVPFFCEKPLGSLEQLPRWREIAAMDLPVNQVGYMLRFNEHVDWLMLAIRGKNVRSVRLHLDWDGHKYQDGRLESSHEIDLLYWLTTDLDGNAPALVDFYQDGTGEALLFEGHHMVWLNWKSHEYRRMWDVEGDKHRAGVRFRDARELGDQMYRDELAHFLECVRENRPTLCPLADGLKVLEICAKVEAMTHV